MNTDMNRRNVLKSIGAALGVTVLTKPSFSAPIKDSIREEVIFVGQQKDFFHTPYIGVDYKKVGSETVTRKELFYENLTETYQDIISKLDNKDFYVFQNSVPGVPVWVNKLVFAFPEIEITGIQSGASEITKFVSKGQLICMVYCTVEEAQRVLSGDKRNEILSTTALPQSYRPLTEQDKKWLIENETIT